MSGDDDAGFSELLLALRQDRGLTQEELAHAAGLSVRALREMERGRVRIPQRRTVELLADVLRLDDQQRARFLAVARPLRTAQAEALAPQYALLSAPSQRMSQPDLGCLAPAQLPAALGDLTGRGPELARITAHAAEVAAASRTTATMVAVHGPPGVGKTSLAVLAGDRVRDHPCWPPGIWAYEPRSRFHTGNSTPLRRRCSGARR